MLKLPVGTPAGTCGIEPGELIVANCQGVGCRQCLPRIHECLGLFIGLFDADYFYFTIRASDEAGLDGLMGIGGCYMLRGLMNCQACLTANLRECCTANYRE